MVRVGVLQRVFHDTELVRMVEPYHSSGFSVAVAGCRSPATSNSYEPTRTHYALTPLGFRTYP